MLYFVATPIGNLKEITYRAVEVLNEVDEIYAEDTRHSALLLAHYDISKPLFSYHKFNEKQKCAEITDKLRNGKNIAVISDAGMPLISDPGNILSAVLSEEGLDFTVISGACAMINALVLSGLSTESFCMAGFLPQKNSDKIKYVEKFKALECSLVFYCPPHDVMKDLEVIAGVLGARRFSVVREISKKFESVHRGILGEKSEIPQKGEMVLVLEGAKKEEKIFGISILEQLKELINSGIDKKTAIKTVADERDIKKSIVYSESLKL